MGRGSTVVISTPVLISDKTSPHNIDGQHFEMDNKFEADIEFHNSSGTKIILNEPDYFKN